MRLIRPAPRRDERRTAVLMSLAMLVVGVTAIGLMALLPGDRISGLALLGIAAALGIGIGLAWLIRALSNEPPQLGDDLARLLAPAFDDSYVLILSPRLPDVPSDLAALLVGPAGVRTLLARRWRGRYRVRGRRWEYDTKSRRGWIPCRTNPSFDGDTVAEAVARWARTAADEPSLPVAPAVAFPRPWSVIILEEPEGEVVTTDNAPWWAQSIGRVQKMDQQRVARFVQTVVDTVEARQQAATTAAPRGLA
ncbi:MAG TPA: hypothetical protein VFQ46_03905 [Candidatus Limnocylindria bacterium]|nr:hypothetical protein [Candidatus Limnocylindria bacterium]